MAEGQPQYRVELTRAADRGLERLPAPMQLRITDALVGLRIEPRPPGTRSLEGHHGLFRIRVGDYRVVVAVDDTNRAVLVVRVGNRRDVYRGL